MVLFRNPDNPDQTIEVPDNYTTALKVEGKETSFDAAEVLRKANESHVATQRFQEASDMRKEAKEEQERLQNLQEENRRYQRLQDLAKKAQAGDNDAFIEYVESMYGYTREQAEAVLRSAGRLPDEDPNPNPNPNPNPGPNPASQTNQTNTPQSSESDMDAAYRSAIEQVSMAETQRLLRSALDKHPRLGRMTEERKEYLLREQILPAAIEAANSGKPQDEAVQAGVQRATTVAETLGILPPTQEQETERAKADRVRTFLGNAGAAGMGLTSSDEGSTVEMPERVPMSDPRWNQNAIDREVVRLVNKGGQEQE